MRIAIIFSAIVLSGLSACRDEKQEDLVTTKGTVYKQGITTYQYGSHVLADSATNVYYALRSNKIDLDQFLNQKIEVKGSLVEGYPVDDGPEFLEVTSVE